METYSYSNIKQKAYQSLLAAWQQKHFLGTDYLDGEKKNGILGGEKSYLAQIHPICAGLLNHILRWTVILSWYQILFARQSSCLLGVIVGILYIEFHVGCSLVKHTVFYHIFSYFFMTS